MDRRLLLATGSNYPIPECQLTLHQPTIAEISLIGEDSFFNGIQIITLNKMMFDLDNFEQSNINNFQLFMTAMSQKETAQIKEDVQSVFTLVFQDSKVIITPQSLLISQGGNQHMIDENNFEFFQEAFKDIFCLNGNNQDQNNFNPTDKKAKEIAEKIMKGRKKVAAEKGVGQGSVFTQYLSILSIGLQMPMTVLTNYTVFQIYDSIQRFGLWNEYDLDIRCRLAGGNPNSHPENWMKNLY